MSPCPLLVTDPCAAGQKPQIAPFPFYPPLQHRPGLHHDARSYHQLLTSGYSSLPSSPQLCLCSLCQHPSVFLSLHFSTTYLLLLLTSRVSSWSVLSNLMSGLRSSIPRWGIMAPGRIQLGYGLFPLAAWHWTSGHLRLAPCPWSMAPIWWSSCLTLGS